MTALAATALYSGATGWIDPIQPRRASSRVVSVTKTPEGFRSVSSKSLSSVSSAPFIIAISAGRPVVARNKTQKAEYKLAPKLSPRQVEMLLSGGLTNYLKKKWAAQPARA